MLSEIMNKKKSVSGAIRSKHRLAEIGHHFLSNENERSPAWKNTSIIPILLGSKHDDHIVYELNHAFNRHDAGSNNSSMVLNIENHLITSSKPFSSADSENTTIPESEGCEESGMPEYCLVPVTSPSTTMALQSDRFIIAVHASLGGVRIAYDQLAFMASLETDFNVCVIMLGAKTITEAERFFGFLCDNAKSLLALELECGGYLLQDSHSISEPNNATEKGSADCDIATDLDSVASEILRKFMPGVKSMAAISLSSPTGVAGLLS